MTAMSPMTINGAQGTGTQLIAPSNNGVTWPTAYPSSAPTNPPARPPVKKRRRGFQNFLTGAVGLIATAASATGMLAYFENVFHITNPYELYGLFAVFEMAMLVEALRARDHRIRSAEWRAEHPGEDDPYGRNIDEIAVWCLATLTGFLAGSAETTLAAHLGRVAVPLVAAWLFHRAMSAEAKDRAPNGRARIHWRITPERIFVALHIADAAGRGVEEIDKTRRIHRIATLRYQLDTAKRGINRRRRRYNTALAKANELYGLSSDPKMVARVATAVAFLYAGVDSTSRAAVEQANPWVAAAATPNRAAAHRPTAPAGEAKPTTIRAAVSPEQNRKVIVTPAATGRRSAQDSYDLLLAHWNQDPNQPQVHYARALGYSNVRGLTKVLEKVGASWPPPGPTNT